MFLHNENSYALLEMVNDFDRCIDQRRTLPDILFWTLHCEAVIVDAEIIYFGFPFPWLEAYRSTWKLQMSWRFLFLWRQFIFDFMIYGLFASTATAISIYFMSLPKRRKTTTHS